MEKAPQVIGLGTSNGSQKIFLVPSEHEHHSVDNYSFVSAVLYKKLISRVYACGASVRLAANALLRDVNDQWGHELSLRLSHSKIYGHDC
jgi:hypothetical protein